MKMISIYLIITALATTAAAKGAMECNLTETTGAHQCFGALAQPLTFYLPKHENLMMILIKKSNRNIFKIRNNTVVTMDKEYSHSTVFIGGRIKINKATKNDSGDYLLETYAANGVFLHKIEMHLEIQAPVSKPAVVQMCLSPDEMNISCSSKGDGVEFILILNSHPLIDTRAHSHSQTNRTADPQSLDGNVAKEDKSNVSHVTLCLYSQLTGNLMCQVRNNVSSEETVLQLSSCQASNSRNLRVTVAVIASAAVLLLLLALLLGIRLLNMKTRPRTVNEGYAEEEIVYSNVRMIKETRRPRPRAEEEIVYSDVRAMNDSRGLRPRAED